MKSVGAFEAKTHLSRLLEEVEQGEEITITKHGRPVARLVPPHPAAESRGEALIEWLLAPAHCPLELANALVMAERRNRLSRADSAAFLARIALLPPRSRCSHSAPADSASCAAGGPSDRLLRRARRRA